MRLGSPLSPRSRNDSVRTVVRQLMESLVTLAIAVLIFRGFGLEGFLISTGSMAPTLLGYHHHLVCPACRFEFDRGTAPPEDASSLSADAPELGVEPLLPAGGRCPNCGFTELRPARDRPIEGDQLLVQKHAYEFRDPQRWEVIVFRNPLDPRQAYVKRLVGLPGESILIRDGEAFANGALCRKPLEIQLATRQVVSSYAQQPEQTDPDWRPRWVAVEEQSAWELGRDELSISAGDSPRTDWIEYRHWIRSGGQHVTLVPLKDVPRGVEEEELKFGQVRYENGMLACTGVLSEAESLWWRNRVNDAEFQAAIEQLAWSSHIAPILDECDYNVADAELSPVDDLCLSLTIDRIAGEGRFELALQHGGVEYRAVFNFRERRIELLGDDSAMPLASVPLPVELLAEPLRIDFSTIDDQLLLAFNESPACEPVLLPVSETVPVRRPARIGATQLSCRVTGLTLSRDIHYTRKGDAERVAQLGPDEFFVLGDNSPVSLDSRAWEHPAVPRSALIGKPLVVHLPSKLGEIQLGGAPRPVRLPDLSRVRVIH